MIFSNSPRCEIIYFNKGRIWRKHTLFKRFLFSLFQSLKKPISNYLLSLRSSLPFMSSLDSTNRLTCQPNFDITALEWKNHNRPSSNSDNDLVTLWLIGLVEEESGHEHLEFILNRKI
ncbi:hypothetical protein H311_00747 [Anncaliia algerae PRA109]|nr:hypothetical protein H311_00747 [Anncaliia algerae PRA109]